MELKSSNGKNKTLCNLFKSHLYGIEMLEWLPP